MASKQQDQGVDITKCNPKQLQDLQKAIETELKTLTQNYQGIMQATKRFDQSKESLGYLKEYGSGAEVMVPMTSSLYVPGVIDEAAQVLVEVGAGYFIEQPSDKAMGYCERRGTQMRENGTKLNQIIQLKKVQMQKVQAEMEKRFAAFQAAQAAQK